MDAGRRRQIAADPARSPDDAGRTPRGGRRRGRPLGLPHRPLGARRTVADLAPAVGLRRARRSRGGPPAAETAPVHPGHGRPRPQVPRAHPRVLRLGARHRLPRLPARPALPRPPLHPRAGTPAVRGVAPGRPDPGHPRPGHAAEHRGVLAVLPRSARHRDPADRGGTGVDRHRPAAAGPGPRPVVGAAAAAPGLAGALPGLRPLPPVRHHRADAAGRPAGHRPALDRRPGAPAAPPGPGGAPGGAPAAGAGAVPAARDADGRSRTRRTPPAATGQ